MGRASEDLAALERDARDAFVHGDNRRSLVLYRRVLDASPRRASAWRGLGLVSAAVGDGPAARRALTRYLSLAPDAEDRERIERELARAY
jgi:regulator of sirC expression with transglutaminase-like and TPR domain